MRLPAVRSARQAKKAEEAKRKHLAAAAEAAKSEAAAAAKEAAARKREAAQSTSSVPVPDKDATIEPVGSAPTPAVDISEAAAAEQAPATVDPKDDLSEGLRALSLAGGDLERLSTLAVGETASTDLALSLKELGFKGLQTRKRLEAELKAYHAAQSA